MEQDIYTQPCLLEEHHASHSVGPGSAEAMLMTVTSGRRCYGLYPKPGQLGLLQKMLLESSAWNSTKRYLTWKARTMTQSRILFRLALSMPRTNANEYGLLPTPTVQDSENNGGPAQLRRHSLSLNALVGGPPNPMFVEWMMGYPTGWLNCEPSETPSSLRSPTSSSKKLRQSKLFHHNLPATEPSEEKFQM